MIAESSRVAALFGFLGLVAGALGGTWVDNTLQRDRDLERYMFQLRMEGVQQFIKGQAGVGGIDPKDNSQVTSGQRTHYGRYLIAVSSPPQWVRAVHDWMKAERNNGKTFAVCDAEHITSFELFYNMRQALFAHANKRWFLPTQDPLPKQIVGEVAVHCFLKQN